ncbi:hypothetical protein [Conexibacter arvalis]|uniref:hypothetical protein n=1 Tax=Conexibacter arvalis TaxID=912552 RepID=UPI00161EEEF0|nr:hypothetical protein [Conexibacter arvalis]
MRLEQRCGSKLGVEVAAGDPCGLGVRGVAADVAAAGAGRLVDVDRAKHGLGEVQQRRGQQSWSARREHVFVKVERVSDGIASAVAAAGLKSEKPNVHGQRSCIDVQEMLQGMRAHVRPR